MGDMMGGGGGGGGGMGGNPYSQMINGMMAHGHAEFHKRKQQEYKDDLEGKLGYLQQIASRDPKYMYHLEDRVDPNGEMIAAMSGSQNSDGGKGQGKNGPSAWNGMSAGPQQSRPEQSPANWSQSQDPYQNTNFGLNYNLMGT